MRGRLKKSGRQKDTEYIICRGTASVSFRRVGNDLRVVPSATRAVPPASVSFRKRVSKDAPSLLVGNVV